jgi:hypothetical protein
VDQGPAARRIEIPNQLIWTHTSKTKVTPKPMKKAFHTNHAIQLKPTPKAFASRLASLRHEFSVFAATPCRGLSLSRWANNDDDGVA